MTTRTAPAVTTPVPPPARAGIRRRLVTVVPWFALFAAAVVALAPTVGSTPISLARVFDRSIPWADNVDAQIFFIARLPRVLAGAVVGGTLASAGVVLQALLRNPLATPFTLGVLRGAWGWSLFGVVWTIAVVGIVMKVVVGVNYPKVSIALYLGMGWLAIVAVKPTLTLLPASGIAWVAAGGLIYTAGVPFYLMDNRRYLHFVWHLFVLGGSLCHFVAVWFYA